MKSRFLFSILGLQIIAFKTVWADRPGDVNVDFGMDFLNDPGDGTNQHPQKRDEDHEMDPNPEVFEDFPNLDGGNGGINFGADFPNLGGGNGGYDFKNAFFNLDEIGDVEDGNDFFRWSPFKENGGCNHRTKEIDRSLDEATTLTINAIDSYDEMFVYENDSPTPRISLADDKENLITANVHLWGIFWVRHSKYRYRVDGLPMLERVNATYDFIWNELRTKREGLNRIPLVCGNDGVEIVENAEKTEKYWQFKHFTDFKIKVPKDDKDDLPCSKRNTGVWFNYDGKPLVLFCESVFDFHKVTLDDMIAYQEYYNEDISQYTELYMVCGMGDADKD